MDDIRTILRMAGHRLEAGSMLRCLNATMIGLGILVVLMLAAERLGAALFLPWGWLGPLVAMLALLIAARLWMTRRRTDLQVAVDVDGRLDLREKLSTALHIVGRDDPFARAAIEDAMLTARDPKTREQVRRRFAVESPDRWWLSPLVIAVALGLWFVEPQNLFASDSEDEATITETVRQRDDAIEAVVKPIRNSPELREELSDLLRDLADVTDADALKTRQDIRRNAIKKLTDLNKRLDEIVNGEKGKTAEAIEAALAKLKTPADGPAKDFADALKSSDFKAAQEALAKLMQDLQDGKLSDEQKKQLARQLADLAEQMKQLAQQQQQLQEMLKQAGLDPQLAQNPQALQQAIANNPNLNQKQKQQLQQMALAQQAAQQMSQGLAQGMNQMAQQLMQGQMQPGGQLGEQLSQLEAMQQLLQAAQAAAAVCRGQAKGLGQGLAMQQAMQMWQKHGGAFGNRGQGAGGKAPISPTPTGTKLVLSPSQSTPGDIIARQFIDGPVIVGESNAQFRAVAEAVSEGFDEAQNDQQVPPKYWEAHMHYFGELKKRVEATRKSAEDEGDEKTEE